MSKMENFIAVQDKTEGIIGKFLYYSTSNILIKRDKFIEIGQSFGLPKFKPANPAHIATRPLPSKTVFR